MELKRCELLGIRQSATSVHNRMLEVYKVVNKSFSVDKGEIVVCLLNKEGIQ